LIGLLSFVFAYCLGRIDSRTTVLSSASRRMFPFLSRADNLLTLLAGALVDIS
jgi:uncharacterized membrane protein